MDLPDSDIGNSGDIISFRLCSQMRDGIQSVREQLQRDMPMQEISESAAARMVVSRGLGTFDEL